MQYFDAIKDLAKRNGMTLTAICEAAGKKRTYISTYTTKKTTPTLTVAGQLAAPLGYGLALVPLDNTPEEAILLTED